MSGEVGIVTKIGGGWTMDGYQLEALRTCKAEQFDQHELAVMALGVAGEAGEVADLVKKVVGHKHPLDEAKLAKELGDVLWYVAVLGHLIGYKLHDLAEMNAQKLRARYPNGFSTEASLARVDAKVDLEAQR